MIKQDWLLKQIEIIVATLVFALTGKQHDDETIVELRSEQERINPLYRKVLKLMNEKKICEAENLIFDDIKERNIKNLYAGVLFYYDLNKLDDNELIANNFSREEIELGLIDLKNTYSLF